MIYAVNKRTKEHRIADIPQGMNGWVLDGCDDIWDVVQADADGWIEWKGGECPLPPMAKCYVRDDYAPEEDGNQYRAEDVVWGGPKGTTITGYRPILDTNPSEPEAPEWGGGLPPVGVEVQSSEGIALIKGYYGSQVWYQRQSGGDVVQMIEKAGFRPLRSAEDKAVEEMIPIICNNRLLGIDGEGARDVARALYRAGYRKTATTDGEDV